MKNLSVLLWFTVHAKNYVQGLYIVLVWCIDHIWYNHNKTFLWYIFDGTYFIGHIVNITGKNNTDEGNILVLSGNKILPEPMLTMCWIVIS